VLVLLKENGRVVTR